LEAPPALNPNSEVEFEDDHKDENENDFQTPDSRLNNGGRLRSRPLFCTAKSQYAGKNARMGEVQGDKEWMGRQI
jgi:hypothetical protein